MIIVLVSFISNYQKKKFINTKFTAVERKTTRTHKVSIRVLFLYIANGLFGVDNWVGFNDDWLKINGFKGCMAWFEGKLLEVKKFKPPSKLKLPLFCDLNWLIVGGFAAWNGLAGTDTAANGLLLFADEAKNFQKSFD